MSKLLVIKRPDQPELDPPYYAALDGDEFQIVQEQYKDEPYPICVCVCALERNAFTIANAVNQGKLNLT